MIKKILFCFLFLILLFGIVSANQVYYDKNCINCSKGKNCKDCKEYCKFIIKTYQKSKAFNSVRWTCNPIEKNTIFKQGDIKIDFQTLQPTLFGYANMGWIVFNENELKRRWEFIVLHESGHAFGLAHYKDGSIMATNGGNGKFKDWQIEIIKSNLKRK